MKQRERECMCMGGGSRGRWKEGGGEWNTSSWKFIIAANRWPIAEWHASRQTDLFRLDLTLI